MCNLEWKGKVRHKPQNEGHNTEKYKEDQHGPHKKTGRRVSCFL